MGKAIRKVGLFVIGILVILPFQSGAHTHTKTTSQLKTQETTVAISSDTIKTKHYYNVVVCKHATPPPPSFEEKLQEILSNLTPAQQSLLEKRLARQRQVTKHAQEFLFTNRRIFCLIIIPVDLITLSMKEILLKINNWIIKNSKVK